MNPFGLAEKKHAEEERRDHDNEFLWAPRFQPPSWNLLFITTDCHPGEGQDLLIYKPLSVEFPSITKIDFPVQQKLAVVQFYHSGSADCQMIWFF
jgi:hypothetical protein